MGRVDHFLSPVWGHEHEQVVLQYSPFWITVANGRIVAIEEQLIP